ncbi:hypothetical protein LEN26_020866 [Aphanomyces euteiches]|nr:hypothetical protein LEN26_020866 [Aphanomyces euteiches]KAH9103483.1 hypothetical protein AeMF1_020181 [Aphanomyces euteiches]KAH9188073.1 hypothetical protein AeNC1_009952 [Aphanomyces euteiches]
MALFRWILTTTAAVVLGDSDILLQYRDEIISARTMDFALDLTTAVEIVPCGTFIQEPAVQRAPDTPDYSWTTTYGFVGFNLMGANVAADGLNEAGLSAAWLYLAGSEYPPVNTTDSRPVVASLVTYILGNFATIDQVRAGLDQIQVAAIDPRLITVLTGVADVPALLPLHVAVHDARNQSLVIEFIDGTMKVHDNPGGVLTNEPSFPEHLASVETLDKQSDLPAGYSSAARFVRLTALNREASFAYFANTSYSVTSTPGQAGIAAALHVINTVAIPTGYIGEGAATQYTVVRDHVRRHVYFLSTQNQVPRRLDLTAIDFSKSTNRKFLPVTFGSWYVDVTADELASTRQTSDLPGRAKDQVRLRGIPEPHTIAEVHLARDTWAALAIAGACLAGVAYIALEMRRISRHGYVALAHE